MFNWKSVRHKSLRRSISSPSLSFCFYLFVCLFKKLLVVENELMQVDEASKFMSMCVGGRETI